MHTDTSAEPSRHKCLIYDGQPSEQLPVVIPFLLDGLRNNWRCLYLGSPEMVNMVDSALAARGADPRRETGRGSLLLTSDRSHLRNGVFEPQAMIDSLCETVDRAVQSGFEGLYATGDMAWELGASQDCANRNFDRLLEYEAGLDRVFQEKPIFGICQYHRDFLPAPAIKDALVTHQSTYIGGALNQDNLFYIPPDMILDRNHSASANQGEWMCQQIVRVLKAEHKRDEALRSLGEMNRDLERRVRERTAELQAANQQLESFSYSVSHDLRAPLRAILGFSQILSETSGEALGEEGRKYLDRVRVNAERMNELIEGFLTLSKVMRTKPQRVLLDLSALSEEVVREVRESQPQRAGEFIVQPGLKAFGDRVLIRAVLVNLVGNAWKFTGNCAHPRIEIGASLAPSGDEASQPAFFVKDNGVGFDMNQAQKLFGVFQRLHGQQDFPGTGIGLNTVQRIITNHGGRIWAESRPNEGATFFFTLPAQN